LNKKKPEERKDAKQMPLKWRLAAKVVSMGSPLSLLRAAGPYGPGLVTKFRPDIPEKFSHIYDDPQTGMLLVITRKNKYTRLT